MMIYTIENFSMYTPELSFSVEEALENINHCRIALVYVLLRSWSLSISLKVQ